MKKGKKKILSGLAGAGMMLSGCSAVMLQPAVPEDGISLALTSTEGEGSRTAAGEIGGYEPADMSGREETFLKIPNVEGQFAFSQDVLSPADDIFNIFGTALTGVCARPAFAMEDTGDTENYYINVHGSMEYSYSLSLDDLKEKEETRILACSCATGSAVVNAAVTGVPVSAILELARLEAGANTFTAVGADGFGIPVPLSYALEKDAMLVYRINGEELPDGQRTQIWMPGTVAKYFTRNVVDIEVTAQENIPEVMEAEARRRAQIAVMNRMEDETLPVGREIVFEGYADDYDKAIAAIQVSMDDGETWTTYETGGATADKWVYWYFSYTPEEAGTYKLTVRAVTETGSVSPLASTLIFRAGEDVSGQIR